MAENPILQLPLRHYRLYPPDSWHGETTTDDDVDARTCVFCVVDVYGLGHHPDDPAPHAYPALSSDASLSPEAEIIRDRIHPALQAARAAELPVIYVNNSAPRIEFSRGQLGTLLERVTGYPMEELMAEPDADDLEYHRGPSRFVQISKLIAPQAGDYFVRKHAYSGFYETRLDSLLRNLGTRTIVFAGFSLDVCLLGTMLDALNRNYEVILLRDCTLASETPEEAAALRFTKRMITWAEMVVGRTTTSDDFVRACRTLAQSRSAQPRRAH